MSKGDAIRFSSSKAIYTIAEIGYLTPWYTPIEDDTLYGGEVGYICASIRSLSDVKVGDKIILEKQCPISSTALPSLVSTEDVTPKRVVYCGLFSTNPDDFENLRVALNRLKLSDSSFTFTPYSSSTLGCGFQCGFLGLLHVRLAHDIVLIN
jgi:GTP-binding protein LepA